LKLPDEQKKLREYILGETGDEERAAVEERLMTDDDYFQGLSMIEGDLIQNYVDGNLDAAERAKFEKRFLISEENRQKVKFARALRKYVNEAGHLQPESNKKPGFFSSLKAFFSSPVPAMLAVLIVLGIAGFFLWNRFSSNNSEVLVALNNAYKNDRPTEARITGFDHAPKIEGTRGNNKNENLDLVFAKSRATEAVLKNETAENLHELGRVYLAENNFDEAIKQFEKALKKNSDIAKIHSDLGVALMEKAKLQDEGKLENFAKANEEIERAIKLDKNLTEAYFNRGLVIEFLKLPNQAKEAWENYLKLDSASPWANEAHEHLQKLETNQPVSKTKEEVLQEFLQARQANDREKAWYTLSRNREIITGKLIPQQLTFLFVESKAQGNEGEAQTALDALKYAGKLEEEKSGDLFWRDVADYYSKIPPEKALILKEAHESLFKGYQFSIKTDFLNALKEFESASQLFFQTGNIWQKQISDNYIASYLGYADKKSNETENERIKITNQILKLSQERNYKWLELLAMMKITSIQNETAQHSSAISNAEKSYIIAKNSEDSYEQQRILGMLASLHTRLGNKKKAIDYTQKVFEKLF
jgi:tetratricopeptide (TPR) repeat protein